MGTKMTEDEIKRFEKAYCKYWEEKEDSKHKVKWNSKIDIPGANNFYPLFEWKFLNIPWLQLFRTCIRTCTISTESNFFEP